MRFKQHNIRSDDTHKPGGFEEEPGDELGDVDLDALAEQLRDDAMHLSDRYPARRPQSVPISRRSRPNFAAWLARVAAVLLVATGVWTMWSLTSWNTPQDELANIAGGGAVGRTPVSPRSIVQPAVGNGPIPLVLPTMSFRDLTAPEQEVLIDLLDSDAHEVRLAI